MALTEMGEGEKEWRVKDPDGPGGLIIFPQGGKGGGRACSARSRMHGKMYETRCQ